MCKGVSKLMTAAALSLVMAACGGEREAAEQLKAQAETEVKNGDYDKAMSLLDTLDTKYAKEVEVRRSAMKYRAMAVEGLTIRRIAAVDDTLALLTSETGQLQELFDYVPNPGKNLGGNLIAKKIVKSKQAIMPRINDEGYFVLAVKINRPIGFESLRLESNDSEATSKPIAPSRLVSVENSEMTVLQQEDVAQMMDWLASHPEAACYSLVGTKKTINEKMPAELREAMVETWHFAMEKQAYRQTLIEREKLERRLQLCRDQLANVIDR